MKRAIKDFLKRFWRNHIVEDFPYPDVCFDCDLPDCKGLCQEAANGE